MEWFSWDLLWPAALLVFLLVFLLFRNIFKWLFRLALRSTANLFFLIFWGWSGILPAIALGANWFNGLILGLLGLPGFGLLYLIRWFSMV